MFLFQRCAPASIRLMDNTQFQLGMCVAENIHVDMIHDVGGVEPLDLHYIRS